jgi:hypothetical protein
MILPFCAFFASLCVSSGLCGFTSIRVHQCSSVVELFGCGFPALYYYPSKFSQPARISGFENFDSEFVMILSRSMILSIFLRILPSSVSISVYPWLKSSVAALLPCVHPWLYDSLKIPQRHLLVLRPANLPKPALRIEIPCPGLRIIRI